MDYVCAAGRRVLPMVETRMGSETSHAALGLKPSSSPAKAPVHYADNVGHQPEVSMQYDGSTD
ncbi:hypothetical protein [Ramlibacter tataouinensis]|uniref:hypothetical protein n=1 Tax=Ramlibacter tataouinensis TaxID=94132 RepID=UPI0011AE90CC|nr:hypothetical protein [Ramlibacter tataouinensis]